MDFFEHNAVWRSLQTEELDSKLSRLTIRARATNGVFAELVIEDIWAGRIDNFMADENIIFQTKWYPASHDLREVARKLDNTTDAYAEMRQIHLMEQISDMFVFEIESSRGAFGIFVLTTAKEPQWISQ